MSSSNPGRVPLSVVLTVPFVLQTLAAVGLTGWLSWSNGRRSIDRLAIELSTQITARIQHRIQGYLTTPYHLNQVFDAAIASGVVNAADEATLQTFFWHQVQHTSPGTTLIYSSNLGEVIGIHKAMDDSFLLLEQNESTDFNWRVYQLDAAGQRTDLLRSINDFNQRYRPWYQAAQQQGQPTWSPIFQSQSVPYLLMTAAHPLLDAKGEMQGVLGVTITLSQMTEFLQALSISLSGQAFIMERSGQLVATSGQHPPLITEGNYRQRLSTIASGDPLVQASAKYLLERFSSFEQIQENGHLIFSIEGERHLLEVTPFQDGKGLDWLVVVVIPEADFTADIQANTRKTVILCAIALIISLLLGSLTSYWIGCVVSQLKTAVKKIAQGQFDQTLVANPILELDQLTRSFEDMAGQLQRSFADLKSLNAALSGSESRLKQFLEALPIGVAVHRHDGSVFYLNPTAKQFLGKDVTTDVVGGGLATCYQLYRAGTNQLYPTAELPALRALRGDCVAIEDLELHKADQIMPMSVRATPIFDHDGRVAYAVVIFEDITARKQAEKLLTDYNSVLEAEVAERTEALGRSEATKQAILSGIPDLLIHIRSDGQYLNLINGGEVKLALEGRETEMLNLYDCVPQALADQRMYYVRQAIATGERQFYQYDIEVAGELRHEEARIVKTGENEALVMVRDITNRRLAEKAQEESLSLLTATLESTAEGILAVTRTGKVLAYNQKILQLWNIPDSLLAADIVTTEHFQILANQTMDPDSFKANVFKMLEHTPEAEELELIHMRDGRILEQYTQPQYLSDRIVGRIWTYRDVTADRRAAEALEAANQELERLANLDGLTQVANRRYFDTYLTQEWQRLAREQQPLALILFDVDSFKRYNDHYGHQAGDDCLIQLSQVARQAIRRPADLLARYGGEEFAVVLPNTDIKGATAIAQKIQTLLHQSQIAHAQSDVNAFVTISLGLSCQIPMPGSDASRLIGQADAALYRAKRQGRNRYCCYQQGIDFLYDQRLATADDENRQRLYNQLPELN